MKKLLTVSIAAYNVEKYLEQALQSCCVSEIMDCLEVIIVDDGSTDSTSKIADQYVELWPETFRVIHKENGGYGSTVNIGISLAKGKYFKLLDGDDWFDRDGLIDLVEILKESDSDMIVSKYKRVYVVSGREVIEGVSEKAAIFQLASSDSVEMFMNTENLQMWGITYKTDILQNNGISLTEHCMYTDTEFKLFPLRWINTLQVIDSCVYCYRIGREGQSISLTGSVKYYQDKIKVVNHLLSVYDEIEQFPEALQKYVFKFLVDHVRFAGKGLIISNHKRELLLFLKKLKGQYPLIYKELRKEWKAFPILVYSGYLSFSIVRKIIIWKMRKSNR